MRNRLALRLVASALLSAVCAAAHTQTVVIRGIHEPDKVTPIEPGAPASGQSEAPDNAVAPLTVEAKRLSRPDVEKQSLNFVHAYATPTAKLDQFARWREPICVEFTALDTVSAAKITARIRAVAKTVGVKVLKAGCTANVEIVFADQPQRWVDWVAEHRRTILGYHYVSDAQFKTVIRPIQSWYETATRTNDSFSQAGLAFGGPGGGRVPGVSSHLETIDDPTEDTPAGCGDSRLTSCLQSVFKNVLIFVDKGRVKDQDPGAVADYLAMLVLSQPRSLDGCAPFTSVIDLFAPNCRRPSPDGLTPTDTAYLQGLYGADLEARRETEEVDIARRMVASLIKARSR